MRWGGTTEGAADRDSAIELDAEAQRERFEGLMEMIALQPPPYDHTPTT